MDENLKYIFNSQKFDSFAQKPIKNYVICSSPRSGSTLLSKGLISTKYAGLPHEYFNIDHKSDFFNRWKFKSLREYVLQLKKHRVTNNGIFGFKIHYHQFKTEFEDDNLDTYFEDLNYIFITRKDKILQGISLLKAMQTGKWSSEFKSINRSNFSYYYIKKSIEKILLEELNWKKYFEENNINPMIINYEELETKYEESIIKILNFLSISNDRIIHQKQLLKQRNFNNLIWKYRYKMIDSLKRLI
jgi:trehalose 2-sulfotransferase